VNEIGRIVKRCSRVVRTSTEGIDELGFSELLENLRLELQSTLLQEHRLLA
jgi:hypothetical protein